MPTVIYRKRMREDDRLALGEPFEFAATLAEWSELAGDKEGIKYPILMSLAFAGDETLTAKELVALEKEARQLLEEIGDKINEDQRWLLREIMEWAGGRPGPAGFRD